MKEKRKLKKKIEKERKKGAFEKMESGILNPNS